MPKKLITEVFCVLVCDGLIIDLCPINRAIKLTPEAIEQSTIGAQSFLISIKVMLQIRRKSMFPSSVDGC